MKFYSAIKNNEMTNFAGKVSSRTRKYYIKSTNPGSEKQTSLVHIWGAELSVFMYIILLWKCMQSPRNNKKSHEKVKNDTLRAKCWGQ